MNKKMAYELLDTIFHDGLDGNVRKIGNGEFITIIRGGWYCWDKTDYVRWMQTDRGIKHFKRVLKAGNRLDSWRTNWAEEAS